MLVFLLNFQIVSLLIQMMIFERARTLALRANCRYFVQFNFQVLLFIFSYYTESNVQPCPWMSENRE